MWQSSNPVLAQDDAFEQFYGRGTGFAVDRPDVTTLVGVVNKTALLVLIAIAAGVFGYWLIGIGTSPSFMWISCLAAMGLCFGAYMVLRTRPQAAKFLAPAYAVAEGLFLGALSGALDKMLEGMGIAVGGSVALQALIITAAIMVAMLLLYRARIVRPTKMLVSVLSVATFGIMLTYLISWPLAMFFHMDLPFIGLTSAFGQGWTPLIGIGINLLILGVASFWLIIDFGMIEEKIASGAPRYMEWYCGFALLVTLAWIYYEAVKLAFRLAILLGNRE